MTDTHQDIVSKIHLGDNIQIRLYKDYSPSFQFLPFKQNFSSATAVNIHYNIYINNNNIGSIYFYSTTYGVELKGICVLSLIMYRVSIIDDLYEHFNTYRPYLNIFENDTVPESLLHAIAQMRTTDKMETLKYIHHLHNQIAYQPGGDGALLAENSFYTS